MFVLDNIYEFLSFYPHPLRQEPLARDSETALDY